MHSIINRHGTIILLTALVDPDEPTQRNPRTGRRSIIRRNTRSPTGTERHTERAAHSNGIRASGTGTVGSDLLEDTTERREN